MLFRVVGAWAALGLLLLAGCVKETPAQEEATADPSKPAPPTPAADQPATQPEGTPEPTPVRFKNWNTTGTMPVDALNTGIYTLAGDSPQLRVDVPSDATALIAEMAFTGEGNDFDLRVRSPMYCGGDPPPEDQLECIALSGTMQPVQGEWTQDRDAGVVGATYVRLELGAEELQDHACGRDVCTWSVFGATVVVVDADFEVHATVFEGGPAPADFRMIAD